ncbi:MAG: hypothetical protein K2J40_04840 [Ruminococcus sp.]|nr:hypothetical protein [Ruminococcus sp.]
MKFLKNLLSVTAVIALATNTVSLNTSAFNAKIAEVPVKYVRSAETEYFDSAESLAAYVREKMTERVSNISFSVPDDWNGRETVIQVLRDSTAETDKPNQGDYLRKSISYVEYTISDYISDITITLDITYNTTAQQEKMIDEKVSEILAELDIKNKSEYDKISAIYEYIINNVTYNLYSEGNLKYTAYGALYNKEAVCQGISMLFYRMAKEAGISCRMIIGDAGGAHAWNIASIDGVYYLLDPTFDLYYSKISDCKYFLRGTEDFDEYNRNTTHIPVSSEQEMSSLDYDYSSEDFIKNYPISDTKYVPKCKTGDLNNDGFIDAVDASAILAAYCLLSTKNTSGLTEIQQSVADVNGDGQINSVDASMVLQYYSYISTEEYIEPDKFFKEKVI